jgi:hypothetical protein
MMSSTASLTPVKSRVQSSGKSIDDDKERLTLRLPKPVYDKLEDLQAATHASSLNDVIKNALLFYDALVQERLKGNDVYVVDPDGEKTKYSVFL